MSQWTHVCGCIRYDALRLPGMQYGSLDEIKAFVGSTCDFESPEKDWDNCTVPVGSEGSIQLIFWENPSLSDLAAFTVCIFGDLRDFGTPEVQGIKDWWQKITTTDNPMVRSAVLKIDIEGGDTIILKDSDATSI